ncbi:hypothetical protein BC940DRAFT_300200 [Gongronella butleri]|nr:hypothetical protein BC940DRAFT_300200 [Gongronella butleri]
MFRTNTQRLGLQLQRPTLFAIRHESTQQAPAAAAATLTPAATGNKSKNQNKSKSASSSGSNDEKKTGQKKPQQAQQQQKKPSLSQRLGGSGRGKIMEGGKQADVFGSFLAQAEQRKYKANKENKQRRFNQQRRQDKPGQFDDAAEASSQRGNKKPQKGKSSSSSQQQKQQQQQQRSPRARAQPAKRDAIQATPLRRATTFIDKDIDWNALGLPEDAQTAAQQGDNDAANLPQENEITNGDYARYTTVGNAVTWPATLDTTPITTLISTNASYSLSQKVAFLSTVAKATEAVAPPKK